LKANKFLVDIYLLQNRDSVMHNTIIILHISIQLYSLAYCNSTVSLFV